MFLLSRQNITISLKESASGTGEMGRSDKCLASGGLHSGRLPHIFLITFNGPNILGSLLSITLGLKTNSGRQKVCVGDGGDGKEPGCQASNS